MKWASRGRSAIQRRSGALDVLTSVNRLSNALREGLGESSAGQIARAAHEILDARSVIVTSTEGALAQFGETVDWLDLVEEQTVNVLDRRRIERPTVYEVSDGAFEGQVAVAVLIADAVPIGTLHVVIGATSAPQLRELTELAAIVSSQLELAELETSRAYAAEAELRALRAQISPHFLHNALTAIAGLVNTDPSRARSLIATLAEFLRVSFRPKTEMTTLAEELLLVEAYIELEQARFGERFAVTLNVAPEALPVQLPFLSIQPLVENAIRHGLEARPGRGSLSIVAENAGPEIAVHVEDDGVGIEPERLSEALSGTGDTSHLGILAVDTRLRHRFGADYGLTISTGEDAGTKVTVRLPKYAP